MKKFQSILPQLVVSPSLLASIIFVYGFIAFTIVLSFTRSRLLPNWNFVGFDQYEALFANDRWWVSLTNLLIFGGLFIFITMAIGLIMAIFLDQKIRFEGLLRSIYLYPMALSFIVTGVSWRWILNPDGPLGLQWLNDPNLAIYCVVIAGVWQSSGFAMALFLAGLRGVDQDMIKAAQVDGATMPMIYRRIIIPSIRPVFFSVALILAHIAIKSFDLIMALTSGGPGTSTDVPAIFMYQFSFNRGQLGLGAASAVMMLMTVIAVIVPLIYAETKAGKA